MTDLVHDLIFRTARRTPHAPALAYAGRSLSYAELAAAVHAAARGLARVGLQRRERVAVYLEKRIENVVALFGAAAAGGAFVPVNPLLKAEQVAHILADCNVRVLVTSPERLRLLAPVLAACPDLRTVIITGGPDQLEAPAGLRLLAWDVMTRQDDASSDLPDVSPDTGIDADMAAILYTSGSTGKPKGVVLSHRNLVAGAVSVASYLELRADDRVLSVLPLSFDYGLSQLTTAFHAGASVVLLNHLFARDIVKAVAEESITVLAAVPPLWLQLCPLEWGAQRLRVLTNSGGAMPGSAVATLRRRLPDARLFLMYGLTEAFRSTYLPPEEIERRPDSMGRAIPNAEVLVVRPDGSLCEAGEPGELVHRGALVALGYWNDPARTAERFKPAPGQDPALPLTEMAVWSGDTVRRDADGFLYFIGRSDDMIKVSGYRISPTEVEEVVYASGLAQEAAAVGVPHPNLGYAIVLVVHGTADGVALLKECQRRLPAYMVPGHVEVRQEALPRNPNGKIDRKLLQAGFLDFFSTPSTSQSGKPT
jgi:acyl-CoA ligase (AMP-forming) (exosortase A-associated)